MRAARFRAIAALAACAALACSTPEQRLADHLEKAARFAEQGQVEDAILAYRSALQLSPDDPDINERLAEQLDLSDDPSAAQFYRDAFRLDPERADAALRAVRILIPRDLTKARKLLRDVMNAHPKYAPAHIAQSDIHLIHGSSTGALVSARRATHLDPQDWKAWYQLGKAYRARILERKKRHRPYSLREANDAIEAFTKADELSGGSTRARVDRARVYGTMPDGRERAVAGFRDAFDSVEGDEQRDDNRLFVALAATEYAAASRNYSFLDWSLRRVIEIAPDHMGAWSQLAELQDVEGGNGQAVLEELIAKRPDDVDAHLTYVVYLIGRNRTNAAMKHLREQIAAGRDAPEYWEQITRIQLERDKVANARATYVEMLDSHPDDPIAMRTDARIAIAEKRFDAAVKTLQTLAEQQDDVTVQLLLARAELGRGNLPDASAAIERAMPDDREPSAELLRLKAEVHYAAGEWQLAVDVYRSLLDRRVRLWPVEKMRLATCLYETGQRVQARELLEATFEEGPVIPEAAIEYAKRERMRAPNRVREILERALDAAPLHAGLLEELVWMDLAARRPDGLRRITDALESGEAGPDVWLLRAEVYERLTLLDAAESDALRALEADPGLDRAVDLLVEIYRVRGTVAQAAASLAEADAAGVLLPGAQHLLGRLYLQDGEPERARAMLEKAVAADARMLGAKSDLAVVLADRGGDVDRALKLAEDVQQMRARDPRAVDAVGYVYLRKGLNEAALEQFRYAIELSETGRRRASPLHHYHLGLALQALGRADEASAAFERALALDPGFSGAADARTRLEATRSQTPEQSSS